ncbi:MAG TPA: dTDP-4-dehydrorhamnose 3,5-epimerase [Gammaproteobacteria bacterium]|nr:dTDP-4-dehydrorhamnose 3,5-epimerase [Gammaproteobacteria bacterium]
MKFSKTKLDGAYVIELEKLEDNRGFFARTWCQKELEANNLAAQVAQANVSYNAKAGTLRGMHYQVSPYEETKLIRCTRGALYDVIVDLRPDSPTYKQWIGIELTADNYKMLYVPANFAHGFITLEDSTEATYFVSEFYTPGAEQGLRWNDTEFGIDWPRPAEIISDKDADWPDFKP